MTLQPPPHPATQNSPQSRRLQAVGITGTGSYVPDRVLTNHDLEALVETTDEWIVTRTGMRERRIAADGEATSDMAIAAGRRALEAAGASAEDVELVLVATASPDHICCPPTACIVQHGLGAVRAAAFDVSSACTSFVSALINGEALVGSGRFRNALVIGAEKLSSLVDYTDRESCVLFGDGAGAVFLEANPEGGKILDMTLGADGSGSDLIKVEAGGSRLPTSLETLEQRQGFISLQGRAVFKFAVSQIESVVQELLMRNGFAVEDLDLFVPHQANLRIIQAAIDRLGIAAERTITTVEQFGNTSSASVPVALDQAVRSGQLASGDLMALVAFGGGLTWGGALVQW